MRYEVSTQLRARADQWQAFGPTAELEGAPADASEAAYNQGRS
jgi:hypothetical protein